MDTVAPRIAKYIEEQFLVIFGEDFDVDTNLFEAGIMDSFGYVQLLGFLQSEFQLTLEDDEFLTNVMSSLRRMAVAASAKLVQQQER
ncbi:phosphopantetheine-binding protein [Agrobacterium vitis]|uniref:phosphopantetheine-binding protein n=1 Tax=Agrobacterium vitis TaxID=373 RepID=UPI001572C257|nr:phosphopantetheine-binding protein [Agrobacterium vitis]NSZ19219.1 acyl carrier protein [Agrobacterium vitis]QZO06096.1 hypothetical protein K4831_20795 [Agrobacterium vitis]UJL90418.1 acyl carrier protein [Agrobacterium vitis]BCH61726.1 hypothetical protein RvVAR0630_43500 [Agrobacterium vitis]